MNAQKEPLIYRRLFLHTGEIPVSHKRNTGFFLRMFDSLIRPIFGELCYLL